MKKEWNLGLLYKGNTDPQIEKDMRAIENACAAFEKKYKKADYISSPKKLLAVLNDFKNLLETIDGSKPWWYFALKQRLDSSDAAVSGKVTTYMQRITVARNKITFFTLGVAKIPKSVQKKFLADPGLKPYTYTLETIFKEASHYLSEGEEQLSGLLSPTSYDMWVDGQEKVLTAQVIEHKGESIPIEKALSLLADLPKAERRELHRKINHCLKSISSFAEAEINAVYNYKKVMDERRGYKKSYSATIESYENNEKSIENLVELVTKHFRISRRFYSLHAKLLGEKKITVADRNTAIGKIEKKFDFASSVAIVRKTFGVIDQKFADVLDRYLENGQIDVYPRKGKSGGAFCWKLGDFPTYVLLNHADNLKSLETLGHEMGHAIHYELSASQPAHYRNYSMATAEVASTFFEQAVLDDAEQYLSDDEKIVLLHSKVLGDVSTIFRQIACFNFEKELHERIRKEGQISAEEIAGLLSKHHRSYLGTAVEVENEDGYFFVNWSHIRRFFYVYSYAYGQIVSRALYEKWKADPTYEKKIEQFLSAGRSMSPEQIFKKIGIDTLKPEFFETGLKAIDADITKLEKMAKKAGMI